MRRLTALIPALFLLPAIFKLDIQHFEKMHYIVPACALYLLYDSYQKLQNAFFVLFLVSIVLYNPFIPATYYMNAGWIMFDIFFGIVFLVKVFKWGKLEEEEVI
ncbi:DUF6804 family protein [Chitinophaga silvisoli]|uniref:Uncharacterized protein n=1 Tax=Chitinophaga silvisoli TaxID=2291814 RepID=A0A3E1P3T1_9BACT|nr:DUF6804 family protein [Chitinophaga silvisoli]RFM34658.1 hypothetical protein DXN04_15445 [Chitinophaga silvisoli]